MFLDNGPEKHARYLPVMNARTLLGVISFYDVAKAVLEAETLAMAQVHGLIVASVGTGDTRSRWGSCTSSGAIRYSWRLILAPAWVRRSTVAHELAHLLHMDHSPAFHAAHARIYGEDPRPARAWLKAHGAGLHRYQA